MRINSSRKSWSRVRLFSERNCAYDPHWHRDAVEFAGNPVGHHTEYALCLFVQRGFDTFEYLHVADRAVGVDNKTTHYASLYACFIGRFGVVAVGVDELNQFHVASGE